MSDARCDITELLVDDCACRLHRGGQVVAVDELETVGQPFEAGYGGICAGCGGPIRPGDQIQCLADGPGYVHAGGCT